MKRPSYRAAILWILQNDDCDFLNDYIGALSVAASLVADMFGVDDARVMADLRRVHANLEIIEQRAS